MHHRNTKRKSHHIACRMLAAAVLAGVLAPHALPQSTDLSGTYFIRVKANRRFLHEDGNGDKLLSTRYQPSPPDDFNRFRLTRQSDGSYRITVVANGRHWHEDGSNDKLVSTRYQPDDNFTRFLFERQSDGSFLVRVKANNRYLHEDGSNDKLLSTRWQPNPPDDFNRFLLEPVNPPPVSGVSGGGERGIKETSDLRSLTQRVEWMAYVNQSSEAIFERPIGGTMLDLHVRGTGPAPYAYTAVKGNPYSKQVEWLAGFTAKDFNDHIGPRNLRPISFRAYDSGNGDIRYAAVLAKNTGGDAKTWWWYGGVQASQLLDRARENNARLVQVNSYGAGDAMRYGGVMIRNTGADQRRWWLYTGIPAAEVNRLAQEHNARLTDLDVNAEGRFNVILEACEGACPAWWWLWDYRVDDMIQKANELDARPFDIATYPGCGGTCVAAILIDNSGYERPAPQPGSAVTSFRIRHSGACLDVAGNGPGSAIVQETCQPGTSSQAWAENHVDGPWALLINSQTRLCVEPDGDPRTPGVPLVQRPCDPNRKEQWFFLRPLSADDDQHLLQARLGEQCADVEGGRTATGTRLLMWSCHKVNNQRFARVTTRVQPSSELEDAVRLVNQRILGIEDPDPEICWKNTTTRKASSATYCPPGYEHDGLLVCHQTTCRAGYKRYILPALNSDLREAVCLRNCPSGTTEDATGLSCLVGFFSGCPDGFTWVLPGVCAKPGYALDRKRATCPPGTEPEVPELGNLSLCYPACPANSTPASFVCWGSCKRDGEYKQECGAACARSIDACVFSITDMITETANMVIDVSNLILTGGAATPALRAARKAAKAAGRISMSAAQKAAHKAAIRKQLDNAVQYAERKSGKKQRLEDAAEVAANNTDKIADALVDALEKGEFDYRELIPTVADVEPTGFLAVVRSFNKPICR